jgi:hypothetical protein
MTTSYIESANVTTAQPHSEAKHDTPVSDNHAMIVSLVFLGWVTALVAAFAAFGLGGFITVATITAWAVLALIVVMTAGG